MADKYAAIRLKNQLCFPIYLCSKEIQRRYTPYLDALDLTYTQYVVMMYLWEHGCSNVKQIGKALLLAPGTLTPLLKKLESKGYLTRARSAADERNLTICLTADGESLKDRALAVPAQMSRCLDLTPDEAETLYTIMMKILLNVEKE